jgi:DNA-binding response OmpR family regulator
MYIGSSRDAVHGLHAADPGTAVGHLSEGRERVADELAPLTLLIGADVESEAVRRLVDAGGVVLLASTKEAAARWMPVLLGQQESIPSTPSLRLGELVVDLEEHLARWRGEPLDLTEQEFRLLATLCWRPRHTWSYEALLARVWGTTFFRQRSPVRSAVKRLRGKLRSAGVPPLIRSVRGLGFRLDVDALVPGPAGRGGALTHT